MWIDLLWTAFYIFGVYYWTKILISEICKCWNRLTTSFSEICGFSKSTSILPPIYVVTNVEECKLACKVLKQHCKNISVLGFDCEWVNQRGPVSLLQLGTTEDFCCLFRLNILKHIPPELEQILSDPEILKLGVASYNDAKLLERDYSIKVRGTLDLNWLYPDTKRSLARLAEFATGETLNKDIKIQCSNWERPVLTSDQINYAANDALVAVRIFQSWLVKKSGSQFNEQETFKKLKNLLYDHVDKDFIITHGFEGAHYSNQWRKYNGYMTRSTPLYDNCFMHAPDGGLLNSCNRRKAQWYVERGLAEVLQTQPYSIRLLFEPASRGVDKNEVKYYQQLKQNCCVVCGATKSYIKHNVIPKEYRKHFPNKMKDHQSHDILLMCVKCHHLADKHNQILKQQLSIKCNAPFKTEEKLQHRELVNIKNCARALLNSADEIPKERKIELENKLKSYFKISTITIKILKEVVNMDTKSVGVREKSHGVKVVNYFKSNSGGLPKLEVLWREHFLNTMKPQFMPAFWSINHNHSRLTNSSDNREE